MNPDLHDSNVHTLAEYILSSRSKSVGRYLKRLSYLLVKDHRCLEALKHYTLLMCYLFCSAFLSLFNVDPGIYVLYSAVCIAWSAVDNKFADASEGSSQRH